MQAMVATENSPTEATLRDFGRLIEIAIGDRKITEVAKAIGTKHPNLRQAIDGDRPLPNTQTVQLARLCGVDIEALIPSDVGPKYAKKAYELRRLWRGGAGDAPFLAPKGSASGSPGIVLDLPDTLRAFFDEKPRLHPAIKHHLELNHHLRTDKWVGPGDVESWLLFAQYLSRRLHVPLEIEGREQGAGDTKPRKH